MTFPALDAYVLMGWKEDRGENEARRMHAPLTAKTNPEYLRGRPDPKPAPPSRPYERPTLHPNDPAFREAAIAWGRREKAVEPKYNASGTTVIAMGFERGWNENQPKLRAAEIAREEARREAEEDRICWCESLGGGPWSEGAPAFWPSEDRWEWPEWRDDPFPEDRGWEWANVQEIGWCLDTGGGWCEFGEDGFWEGSDGGWSFEGDEGWTQEDEDFMDALAAEAWAEWRAED